MISIRSHRIDVDPSEIGYDDVIGNKFYVNLYHINYG